MTKKGRSANNEKLPNGSAMDAPCSTLKAFASHSDFDIRIYFGFCHSCFVISSLDAEQYLFGRRARRLLLHRSNLAGKDRSMCRPSTSCLVSFPSELCRAT